MRPISPDLEAVDRVELQLQRGASPTSASISEVVVRSAIEDGVVASAKEFTREFLGSSRVGGRAARRALAVAKQNTRAERDAAEKRRILGFVDELEQIVGARSADLPPRSVVALRRRAARARTAVRPGTARTKALELASALRVELLGAAQLPSPVILLADVERCLRALIRERLSSQPNWWASRVPADVRSRAEERAGGRTPLLEFVDFSDYQKIILQRNNWEEQFRHVFRTKEWISTRLAELLPLRNDIAHSRTLSYEDSMRFRVFAQDILAAADAER